MPVFLLILKARHEKLVKLTRLECLVLQVPAATSVSSLIEAAFWKQKHVLGLANIMMTVACTYSCLSHAHEQLQVITLCSIHSSHVIAAMFLKLFPFLFLFFQVAFSLSFASLFSLVLAVIWAGEISTWTTLVQVNNIEFCSHYILFDARSAKNWTLTALTACIAF